MTNDEKIALIKELRDDYDHGFISPEGVRRFTEPFGFTGATYMAEASPHEVKGLTLANGAAEAEGQDAAVVAQQIARHLNVPFVPSFGRGSALRNACNAIIDHLQQ